MALSIKFVGGAGTVTGSNFLIKSDSGGTVLVDCGIEQGRDFSVDAVYGKFPYDPKEVDALVITHAHLDHVGRAPKLVRDGFRGKVYMTSATRDLSEFILGDSVGILAEEARMKHLPILYEEKDVERFLSLVEILPYHEERVIAEGISVYLRNTGHILGSASVRITGSLGETLALTGDIGNSPSPLLPDWEPVPDADVLVMESVYGDRLHPARNERAKRLLKTLNTAIKKGGTILMPAFSMERTQIMLYEISNFIDAGEMPEIPVFLDSPLAIHVTDVYRKHGPKYFKSNVKDEIKRDGDIFDFPFLKKTLSRRESNRIQEVKSPKLIIAGAGMSHGGRIGRHEARYLPDTKTTLIIVGYQAPGSPGRLMQDGVKKIRLAGRNVRIRGKVEILEGWSGHADRNELLDFASKALPRAKTIFTALGEPGTERFLAQRIRGFLGGNARVPQRNETWEITKKGANRLD
ncbi:Metallo-beta-lactamase family protein, RNA-specific [hydrothermal vent metagenome]|uniref:Metallo-beta-lactamase family protein, RNA-specific n=1 Tax=hydrothermal vent metagenome TaxID=652676 RepID=A0A3B0VMH4_9ZZZZ